VFELPVKHPSPARLDRLASGVATAVTTIPVAMPANAIPGSAELVISVDPDGLSGLEEGLRDLVQYPYGCLEQTTSKLIPMLAARDLAEALAIDGLTGPALDGFVKAGVVKIGKHQTAYGGLSLWPGGDPDTYLTAYGLWGLQLAKQAGYPVDAARIDDALAYLRNNDAPNTQRPHYYEQGDLGSRAFALYVRSVLGDKGAQPLAAALLGNVDLPIYGKSFVARAVAVGLGAKDPVVVKMVSQLAAIATAATKAGKLIDEPHERDLWAYMSSSPRTTAAVLWALVELDPKNAAIRPLVDLVMKHRNEAPYYDTQSNSFTLLALTAYAKTLAGTPSSVAVAAGGQSVLSGVLTGKQRIRVATVPLAKATELQLTPTGEVHYHVGVRYRREVKALVAESHGITVKSEYLDEAGAPKRRFVVGDVVRIRVTYEQQGDYDNEMVSVALPAGFEPLNTRFKTTGSDVVQTSDWGTYQEMHDDRVDYASIYSSRGHYKQEFSVRAIAAGTFIRPPTLASLMYQPTITAQTAAETIAIEAK